MRGFALTLALVAISSPTYAFDNFGQITLPCESGNSAQSCPGILRPCSQIKEQVLKSVEESIAARVEGVYHGQAQGATEPNRWPPPVCDLIAGEVERSKAESCPLTKDTHGCGAYQYTKVRIRGDDTADVRVYCELCPEKTYEGQPVGTRETAWMKGLYVRGLKCALEQVKAEINAGALKFTSENCADMGKEVESSYKGMVARVTSGGQESEFASLCSFQGEPTADEQQLNAQGAGLAFDPTQTDRQRWLYVSSFRQGVESQFGIVAHCEADNRAREFYQVDVLQHAEAIVNEAQDRAEQYCKSRVEPCEPSESQIAGAAVSGSTGELRNNVGNCLTTRINQCYREFMPNYLKGTLDTFVKKSFGAGSTCPFPKSAPKSPGASVPGPAGAPVKGGAGILASLLSFLVFPFRGGRKRRWLPIAGALVAYALIAVPTAGCDCDCCCGSCDDDGSECCQGATTEACGLQTEEDPCADSGGLCDDPDDPPIDIPFEEVGQINKDTSGLAGGLTPTEGDASTGGSTASRPTGSAATAGGAGPMGGGGSGDGAGAGFAGPKASEFGKGGGGGGGPAGGAAGGGGMTVDPTSAAAQAATGGAFDSSMDEAAYEGGGGGGGKDGGGAANPFGSFGAAKDGGVAAGGEDLGFGAAADGVDPMLGEDPDDYFSRIDPNKSLFKIVQIRYEKKQAGWILDDSAKASDEGRQRLDEIKKKAP